MVGWKEGCPERWKERNASWNASYDHVEDRILEGCLISHVLVPNSSTSQMQMFSPTWPALQVLRAAHATCLNQFCHPGSSTPWPLPITAPPPPGYSHQHLPAGSLIQAADLGCAWDSLKYLCYNLLWPLPAIHIPLTQHSRQIQGSDPILFTGSYSEIVISLPPTFFFFLKFLGGKETLGMNRLRSFLSLQGYTVQSIVSKGREKFHLTKTIIPNLLHMHGEENS